ncbi:hypothetical protein [uncultured Marivita sp.]|uniref:hypothetical protein n=1 Tax=uncultured Marivita sp. TaxID=888080 RepID=UPI00263259CA|nr:hypothetical protein [uncultured Marivita sp.]
MTETQMRRDVLEIPAAVQRLLDAGRADIQAAAEAIRALSPGYMISVARGSSDHVATYLKYATTDRVQRAQVSPIARTGHPLTDPMLSSAAPDAPRHLQKVTETR